MFLEFSPAQLLSFTYATSCAKKFATTFFISHFVPVALMEETNIAPFLSHQERGHGEREEKNGILAL